jgi:hypothetical protein
MAFISIESLSSFVCAIYFSKSLSRLSFVKLVLLLILLLLLLFRRLLPRPRVKFLLPRPRFGLKKKQLKSISSMKTQMNYRFWKRRPRLLLL